jgi:hypothetical protein
MSIFEIRVLAQEMHSDGDQSTGVLTLHHSFCLGSQVGVILTISFDRSWFVAMAFDISPPRVDSS